MKKPKNKFIIAVVFLIITIVWYSVLDITLKSNIDRSSYIILLDWKATLNNNSLILEEKTRLNSWDNIKTIWDTSLAMIKWWDWSITRMWWDSTVIIKESNIDESLLNINISFKLEKWKTWSNVISFIWKDSHFHQEFADTTAAVRWTVFEVNLEKDYLYVESHEVKLTNKAWATEIISEKIPFIISDFSFTSLLKFIKDLRDDNFRQLNIKLDKQFYNDLVVKVWDINKFTTEEISNISNLTKQKKQELYNKTLSQYQKLNFIDTDDISNYKKKLEIKESLIVLSGKQDKQNLLITTLYDFKDLAKNKQFEELQSVTLILSDNRNILNDLDINLEDYINLNIIESLKVPNILKKEFESSFNNIKNTLNINDLNMNNELLIDSAKKWLDWVVDNLNNFWNNLVK